MRTFFRDFGLDAGDDNDNDNDVNDDNNNNVFDFIALYVFVWFFLLCSPSYCFISFIRYYCCLVGRAQSCLKFYQRIETTFNSLLFQMMNKTKIQQLWNSLCNTFFPSFLIIILPLYYLIYNYLLLFFIIIICLPVIVPIHFFFLIRQFVISIQECNFWRRESNIKKEWNKNNNRVIPIEQRGCFLLKHFFSFSSVERNWRSSDASSSLSGYFIYFPDHSAGWILVTKNGGEKGRYSTNFNQIY